MAHGHRQTATSAHHHAFDHGLTAVVELAQATTPESETIIFILSRPAKKAKNGRGDGKHGAR
jgi:hypothetical protein